MSREIDLGWEDHVYEDQDELIERLTQEFHNINNIHFAGKYDINDRLSKNDLHTFLWAAYNYCMDVHYDGAGVEPGSKLKRPDYLTITKYKTSYAGKCRSYGPAVKGGTYEISISYRYYEDWGFVQTLETLYHEIAHLTYFDHSEEFWKEGERIGFGLQPAGVKPRPVKFRQYCGKEGCDWEWFSISRPSKYVICPYCYPIHDGAPEPNYDTWLALPFDKKVWTIVEKYTGPEILRY